LGRIHVISKRQIEGFGVGAERAMRLAFEFVEIHQTAGRLVSAFGVMQNTQLAPGPILKRSAIPYIAGVLSESQRAARKAPCANTLRFWARWVISIRS